MKTSTVPAIERRFVEPEFFKDAETLWQQVEQALRANGLKPLTPIGFADAYRFFLATADQIFTHALVLAFLNSLRQWAKDKIEARHVTTPQIHVYGKGCHRGLARDAIQVRWHYLYSLTRRKTATVQLLRETGSQKTWFGISMARITSFPLGFNQLLIHEVCECYAVRQNRAVNPLDGTILLHGYLW